MLGGCEVFRRPQEEKGLNPNLAGRVCTRERKDIRGEFPKVRAAQFVIGDTAVGRLHRGEAGCSPAADQASLFLSIAVQANKPAIRIKEYSHMLDPWLSSQASFLMSQAEHGKPPQPLDYTRYTRQLDFATG
jgi:hypothetical protein